MILENIILFGGGGDYFFFLTTNKLKKRLELEWEKHIFFKDKTDFFIENIDTFFVKQFFLTLCTRMQQMKVEEEEMTQGVAERWSKNYKGFSEIWDPSVILVWSSWSLKLRTVLVGGFLLDVP